MHKVHIIPCLLGGVPCFCCIFPFYSWQCTWFTTTVVGKKDNILVTNYTGSTFPLKLTTCHNMVMNTFLFPKRALNWNKSLMMALISCGYLQNTAVFTCPSFRELTKEVAKNESEGPVHKCLIPHGFSSTWLGTTVKHLIPLQFIKYSSLLVHKWF